jgi:3-methyladenine DNA glycosylase AlkD
MSRRTAPRPASTPAASRALGRLKAHADPERAKAALWFFKTGPGEYGEGDRFLGVAAGPLRALAREFQEMPLAEVLKLLRSPWHEARSLALLVMGRAYARGDEAKRKAVYGAYLANTQRVNGWDLVDCSAEHVVGAHLQDRSRAPLRKLARSKSLWERRIAIVATFRYIKRGEFAETLRIAGLLVNDRHDLIHKAVGWMLREVGKRGGLAEEEAFLREHCRTMPRTMLRYAIERFPEPLRRAYLKGRPPAT